MISNIIFQRTTSTLSGERVRSIPKSSHSLQGGKLFFLIFSFPPSPTKLFAAIFAGEKSMFYYSYLCATREVEVLSRSPSPSRRVGEVVVVVKSCRMEWLPLNHYSLIIINYSLDQRSPNCKPNSAN
jgi:hypothetical protein